MKLFLVVYELFLLFFIDRHAYEYNFSYTSNSYESSYDPRVTSFHPPLRSSYELRVWQYCLTTFQPPDILVYVT